MRERAVSCGRRCARCGCSSYSMPWAAWWSAASGAIAEALLLLNLPAAATLDEIKQTYRCRLAHAHHPDRHAQADAPTQRAHSARFAELTAAYRLLQKGRR